MPYDYHAFEPEIWDQLRADAFFNEILDNGFADIAPEILRDYLESLRKGNEHPLTLIKMHLFLLMRAEEETDEKAIPKKQRIQEILRDSIWSILNNNKYQEFSSLDYDFLGLCIRLDLSPTLNNLLFENRKEYFKKYGKNILKGAANQRKEEMVNLRDSSAGLKVSKLAFEALINLLKKYGDVDELFVKTKSPIQESKGVFQNLPNMSARKTKLDIPKPRAWYSPPGRAIYNVATIGFNILLSVFTGIQGLFTGSPLKGVMRGMRPIDAIVLPARGFHNSKQAKASLEEKLQLAILAHSPQKGSPLQFERFKLKTMDGAELDTFEISHQGKNPKDQKYIVYFMGNGDGFQEHAKEMIQQADALGCNTLAFNYRGVADSKEPFSLASQGDAPHVRDGLIQIQRLLTLGVKPENIMIKGHSLGGYISTQVASICHRQNIPVYLFNDRSLSSLPDYVSARVALRPARLLAGSGWNQNAAFAYQSIPDTHRQYVVAREPKQGLQVDQLEESSRVDARKPVTDAVIGIEASIHKKFTREMKALLFDYYCQEQKITGHKKDLLKLSMSTKPSTSLKNEEFIKAFGQENAQNHIKNLKMLYKYPKLQLGWEPRLPPKFPKDQKDTYYGRIAHSAKLYDMENIIEIGVDESGDKVRMTGEDIFVHFYNNMGIGKRAHERIYEHVKDYFFPIVQTPQRVDRKAETETPRHYYTPYANNGHTAQTKPHQTPTPPPRKPPPPPPSHHPWSQG